MALHQPMPSLYPGNTVLASAFTQSRDCWEMRAGKRPHAWRAMGQALHRSLGLLRVELKTIFCLVEKRCHSIARLVSTLSFGS